jgi:voltage-gated potassium channel
VTQQTSSPRRPNYVYHLFIFALTVFSLVIMVATFLPFDDEAIGLLQFYDNLICFFFLVDFFLTLRAFPNKSDFFFKKGGWLELLGSLPFLGMIHQYLILLRLARLNRLFRIARLLRGKHRADYIEDVLENRTRYAVFVTIILAIIILATASVLVLEFESQSPDSTIRTGPDAIWYSFVTITTVGYGDFYPVTPWGRVTAIFLMVAGVGIIGALASLLSSVLLNRFPGRVEKEAGATLPPAIAVTSPVDQELALIKNELANLRQLMEKMAAERDAAPPDNPLKK